MPLEMPNLDDRAYRDLVQEARALIPTYAPEWTNHNPSDPGITLIELFAYLTEMLIYRQNRVTDANLRAFLKLLNGPQWKPSEDRALSDEIRDAVLALRRPDRAVTCEDFENLALLADSRVARARCVSQRNLDSENPLAVGVERPGHMSVVIVPEGAESHPQPDLELIETVKNYLEPRRLLTTQVHVAGPRYFKVGVRLTLVLEGDALEQTVRTQVVEALRTFLHPLTGGDRGKGWPFGRNVYVSEIYELLDTQPGVDYVTRTVDPVSKQSLDEFIVPDAARLEWNAAGDLVAVKIQPDELVDAQIEPNDITIIVPVEV